MSDCNDQFAGEGQTVDGRRCGLSPRDHLGSPFRPIVTGSEMFEFHALHSSSNAARASLALRPIGKLRSLHATSGDAVDSPMHREGQMPYGQLLIGQQSKIPLTIIAGGTEAGKTSLVRHLV